MTNRIVAYAALLGLLFPGALVAQAPALVPVKLHSSLEELDFKTQLALAIDKSGCIALTDEDEHQVVCVNPTTGAVKRIGRKGSGPGEFQLPLWVVARPGGGLAVHDAMTQAITLLSPTFAFEKSFKPDALLLALVAGRGDTLFGIGFTAVDSSNRSEMNAILVTTGKTVRKFSLSALDSTGKFIDPAIPGKLSMVRYAAPTRSGWIAGSANEYAVFRSDLAGKKTGTMSRKLPPEPITEKEKRQVREQVDKQVGGATPAQRKIVEDIVQKMLNRPRPPINAFGIVEDPQGRVWVPTTRIRADSSEIDVFDSAGKFLGTRRIAGKVQRLQFSGGDLYALTEYTDGDREEMKGVLRFRIR
jgi:hypothetical protein